MAQHRVPVDSAVCDFCKSAPATSVVGAYLACDSHRGEELIELDSLPSSPAYYSSSANGSRERDTAGRNSNTRSANSGGSSSLANGVMSVWAKPQPAASAAAASSGGESPSTVPKAPENNEDGSLAVRRRRQLRRRRQSAPLALALAPTSVGLVANDDDGSSAASRQGSVIAPLILKEFTTATAAAATTADNGPSHVRAPGASAEEPTSRRKEKAGRLSAPLSLGSAGADPSLQTTTAPTTSVFASLGDASVDFAEVLSPTPSPRKGDAGRRSEVLWVPSGHSVGRRERRQRKRALSLNYLEFPPGSAPEREPGGSLPGVPQQPRLAAVAAATAKVAAGIAPESERGQEGDAGAAAVEVIATDTEPASWLPKLRSAGGDDGGNDGDDEASVERANGSPKKGRVEDAGSRPAAAWSSGAGEGGEKRLEGFSALEGEARGGKTRKRTKTNKQAVIPCIVCFEHCRLDRTACCPEGHGMCKSCLMSYVTKTLMPQGTVSAGAGRGVA